MTQEAERELEAICRDACLGLKAHSTVKLTEDDYLRVVCRAYAEHRGEELPAPGAVGYADTMRQLAQDAGIDPRRAIAIFLKCIDEA